MAAFEYKVIPAPAKGRKAPGVKGAEARFAHGLQEVMNEMARDGWEYLRADILPSEERQGLASTHTVYRSVLVFRRPAGGPGPADAAPTATAAPGTPAEGTDEPPAPADAADATETRAAPSSDEDTTNDPPGPRG
ncbi:MAG: DUF4177 domain-containing protein [Roseovarius sp.]|nr:DUF4177 domain-containing protein [Roseovarius sp.]